MSDGIIECQKGDPLTFYVDFEAGELTGFDQAALHVRDRFDKSLPALIDLDETNGITLDVGNNRITVAIPLDKTTNLAVIDKARDVAAMLHLSSSTDATLRDSFSIPFRLLPEA